MANRVDNVRLVTFIANQANNHNHFDDHRRPMFSTMLAVPDNAEAVIIEVKPGEPVWLPGSWPQGDVEYGDKSFSITCLNNTKVPFATGGIKTK